MSEVELRIDSIERTVQKLLKAVNTHLPRNRHSSANLGKGSKSPTIWSILDKLSREIQDVKAMCKGHDRNPDADERNIPLEAPLSELDAPCEREPIGQISTDTVAPIIVPTSVGSPEVGENTSVDVSAPRRSCASVPSTLSLSGPSMHSVSHVSQNPAVTIPYREEHGVVVLMPLNMDQCRDPSFLLSQAEALGARQTGIFKYVLPADFDFNAQAVHNVTTRVSKFTSCLGQDEVFLISRNEEQETLDIEQADFIPTGPDELAELLERRLANPEAMSKMRYCTDIPAWTAEDRRRLGLPAESPIWPLKDNLLDRPKYSVDGVHRPYGYLSGKDGSVFTIHCEDADLISFNALYRGREKPWCAVARKDGHLIENEVGARKCAQKVRHASRWIPRSKLKAMGVCFVALVQRPGEVVVVWGDIYHQGGTVGPATSEAVNYGDPNWSIKGYSDCSRTCPGYPIPNALLEFRDLNEPQRNQDDAVSLGAHDSIQSQRRNQLARNRPLAPTQSRAAEGTGLRIGKQEKGPRKRHGDVPTAQQSRKKATTRTRTSPADMIMTETDDDLVSRMVAAIRCRGAIKQFFDIVQGRRDPQPGFRMNLTTSPTKRRVQSEDPAQKMHEMQEMLENDVSVISMLSRKTIFHNFLTRLFQIRLADHAEKDKRGRLRSETADIQEVLRRTGMSNRQYQYHRERGMKWRKYCDAFPGILCFIPFESQRFGLSSKSWLDLDERKLASFFSRLGDEYTSALCVAGRAFEHSLDSSADDVDFAWETQVSPDKISNAKLLSALKLFPTMQENIYDPEAYPGWPRPDEWPSDSPWPVDPTSLLSSGGEECNSCHRSNCPCELCHRRDCQCATVRRGTQPRIRNYTGKYGSYNRGLQAVAWEAGQIAYSKGAVIGFITGELTPPDMYDNGRCIQVVRSDIPGEPTVAQINSAECGNIYRLVNASCDPRARFRGMRVSGKFRIAIVAVQTIYDEDEITVDYGKAYWERTKCRCPKCRARPSQQNHASLGVYFSNFTAEQ